MTSRDVAGGDALFRESISLPVEHDSQAALSPANPDHSIGPLSAIHINSSQLPSSQGTESSSRVQPLGNDFNLKEFLEHPDQGSTQYDLGNHGDASSPLQNFPMGHPSNSFAVDMASQAWSGDFDLASPRISYTVPESSIGEESFLNEYDPTNTGNYLDSRDEKAHYPSSLNMRYDDTELFVMEGFESTTIPQCDDDLAGLTDGGFPNTRIPGQQGRPIPQNRSHRSSASFSAKDRFSFRGTGAIEHSASGYRSDLGLPASCPSRAGLFSPVAGEAQGGDSMPIDAKRLSSRVRSTSVTSNPRQGPLAPLLEVGGSSPQGAWRSLENMPEGSQELARSGSGKSRGKRIGPMELEAKIAAGRARKTKQICISCRSNKTSCDLGSPCGTCKKSRRHSNTCVRAEWVQSIKESLCASLFHRSYSVRSSQGTITRMSQIPRSTHLPSMLRVLQYYKNSYNLTVVTVSAHRYTINLSTIYELLLSLAKETQQLSHGCFEPRDLFSVSNGPVKVEDFLSALDDSSSLKEVERLTYWGRMPCHSTFYLQLISNGSLDPLYTHPEETIQMFVALNRLMLRAVEIQSHATLQDLANRRLQTGGSTNIAQVTMVLGLFEQYCCALRLRYAWCRLYERPHSSADSQTIAESRQRLREVLKSLYFWIFKLREKLEKNDKEAANALRRNESSFCIGGRWVNDPLPTIENEAGFETWLDQGRNVLMDAGLAPRSSVPH